MSTSSVTPLLDGSPEEDPPFHRAPSQEDHPFHRPPSQGSKKKLPTAPVKRLSTCKRKTPPSQPREPPTPVVPRYSVNTIPEVPSPNPPRVTDKPEVSGPPKINIPEPPSAVKETKGLSRRHSSFVKSSKILGKSSFRSGSFIAKSAGPGFNRSVSEPSTSKSPTRRSSKLKMADIVDKARAEVDSSLWRKGSKKGPKKGIKDQRPLHVSFEDMRVNGRGRSPVYQVSSTFSNCQNNK